MSKSKLQQHSHQKIEEFRHLRGLERKIHFESGGTPSSWRGTKQIIPDFSKESSKMMCRESNLESEDDYESSKNHEWADHLGEE